MAPPDLEFKYDGSFEQHVGTGNPALVKKTHKVPYLAISPSRPELSQSGKTILITGSSAGIGSFIARGFAQASASRVILTGRRQHILDDTAAKLSQEFGQTEFLPLPCDVGNLGESTALWTSLQEMGIFVDVLVLNAATFGGEYSILSGGIEKTWPLFETNVRSLLHFTERLHKQESYEDKRKVQSRPE
ncbi:putative short chain dehydrogenase protein [Ilyonectria robusta]